MTERSHIHVIDPDFRRRARISRELMRLELHPEIYESVFEFGSQVPKNGMIFASDDAGRSDLPELIEMLDATGRRLPVAMYSNEPSPEKIVHAMLSGALDYLQWPFEPELLNSAVSRLQAEGKRRSEQDRRRARARALVEALSPRELEVLSLVVLGNANKEIAEDLGISPRTVEIHRSNMMRKLNARSTSDAVRVALYAGIDEELNPQAQEIAA
jgi:FixJ family two-component response regulator